MFSEDHLYSIALRKSALIGDFNFKKLVNAEGSAENVWKMPAKQLLRTFGIGQKTIRDIGNPAHLHFAEKELEFCTRNNIKIHLAQQGRLPHLLNECDDAPAILYQKGEYATARTPVSIVGTRAMTPYGRQFISMLLEAVSAADCLTVSGLALGVDAEVHQKSLDFSIPTAAVLAHGFHTLYPSRNQKLSEDILARGGALFTEFNSSQKPDRENFIQRNRIIAGISPTTIVVETAYGGGSVSTVTFANQYNRDVFALPGKLTDRYSQGCNHLIYTNKAAAISTIEALVQDLKLFQQKPKTGLLFSAEDARPALAGEEKAIMEVILQNPNTHLDDLSEMLQIPAYKLLPVLLSLEISGYIKSFSGRQFAAI